MSQEPPCKRFTSQSMDDITYNLVRAHSKLRENGCSRLNSIRFLTKLNCKVDASTHKVGPRGHDILRMSINRFHCLNGWMYGAKTYKTSASDLVDQVIGTIREDWKEFEPVQKKDQELQQRVQTEISHHERFVNMINEKYALPQGNEQKLEKLLQLKKQVRKLHNIFDLKKLGTQSKAPKSQRMIEYYYMQENRSVANSKKLKGLNPPSLKDFDNVMDYNPAASKESESPSMQTQSMKKLAIPSPFSHRPLIKQRTQPHIPLLKQKSKFQLTPKLLQKTVFPTEATIGSV